MTKNMIKSVAGPFDVFDEIFTQALRPSLFSTPQWSGGSAGWEPQVDVQETDDVIVIRAALPGVKKDEIELEIKDGRLILTGKMKQEVSDEGEGWVRREISSGSFYRAFSLPSGMQTNKVEAKQEDGVLEIRIPKAEEARPRTIKISTEDPA